MNELNDTRDVDDGIGGVVGGGQEKRGTASGLLQGRCADGRSRVQAIDHGLPRRCQGAILTLQSPIQPSIQSNPIHRIH